MLRGSLEGPLGKWLVPIASSYGMHLTATSQPGVDVESAAVRVLRDGVKIHTLERYFLGSSYRTGLVFGFGASEPSQLALGIEKLRRALSRD